MRLHLPVFAFGLVSTFSFVAPPADAHGLTPAAPPPASATERPLTALPDIEVRAAPAAIRVTALAADADWAHAAPRGRAAVYGMGDFTARERAGTAGKAWLWPGDRPLPVARVEGRDTRFSPDGKHLVVTSDLSPARAPDGRSWLRADPTITVLRVADLGVVYADKGSDPRWTSPSTIAFRRGRRAFRLDLGAASRPIGPSQPTFGCAPEAFAPSAPSAGCADDTWTSLWSIDRALSTWVVEDSSMSRHMVSLRAIDLATGVSRTIAKIHDHGEGASLRPFEPSPGGAHVCAWHVRWGKPGTTSLLCAAGPTMRLERVLTFSGEPGGAAWLDDQRLFVAKEGAGHVADLEARTIRRVSGLPAGVSSPVALPGGRRVILGGTAPVVLDLGARTVSPYGPAGEGFVVEPAPATDTRVIVRGARASGKGRGYAYAWVDL